MTVGTVENTDVAKKTKTRGRPKSENPRGEGRQVRLDADLIAKADLVARRKGLKLGPYLSELLEPTVNREYVAVLRELSALEGAK